MRRLTNSSVLNVSKSDSLKLERKKSVTIKSPEVNNEHKSLRSVSPTIDRKQSNQQKPNQDVSFELSNNSIRMEREREK